MEINLITGATAYEAAKNTIEMIDTNNFDFQNLVVVPDAFSMQAENLIFDTLSIKSTFNIEVVGISRLANKILRDNSIECKRITGLEEVFCIYKAVQSTKDKFLYFKSSGVEFCQRILQIIKQFKGSKIKPEQIKQVGDENLDAKMHDLKLIYQKYETLLEEKYDLSKLLEFFLSKTENEIDLSKTNLYVVNFDSFSAEIGSFLCRLASKVNKMYVGMAKPLSPNNAFVYEDDILKKLTNFAKQYNISVNVQSKPTQYTGNALKIVSNLFGFDIKNGEKSDFMFHAKAKNAQEEVEFVAKYIKREAEKGKKFNDFALAVSNDKYYEKVKNVFQSYGIAVYCDDASALSNTVLGQFLLKILQMANQGLDKQCFQYFASCFLFGREDEILKQIDFYNVQETREFVERFPKYQQIISQIEMLQKSKTVCQYIDVVMQIVDSVKQKHSELLLQLEEQKFFKKQSENSQALELVEKVAEKLREIAGNESLEIFDFENIFTLALKSVKVETIPTFIDAVYVGLATESYFEDVDNLFVLGATSNSLPASQGDTSILDDQDIAKLKLNFVLEPEIRVLNRRKRLKLFEVLPHAKRRLIVSTPQNEDGQQSQPSNFVEDLLKIFGQNSFRLSALDQFGLPGISEDEQLQRLLFQIGCRENLLPYFTKMQDCLPERYVLPLKMVINDDMPTDKKIDSIENLSIMPVTFSASELETYFNCPLKHFLTYVLKIKPKENIEPTKLMFGNFMHEILRIFVYHHQNLKNISDKEIDLFLSENLMRVAKTKYDEKVLKRKYFVKFLQTETKLILKNIVKEQKFSDFKPLLLEEKILFDITPQYKLKGFVDRVDVCGNNFRILDYKTGETGSVRSQLFYGTKLQLFLYALAIRQKIGKNCVGAFYFDCQTKFSKQNKSQKLLSGMAVMDNDVIIKMDERLAEENYKSDILGCAHKKNKSAEEFVFSDGITFVKNFSEPTSYAKQISQKAISEIEEGYIQMKPFKGSCQKCPYKSICRHNDSDGIRTNLKSTKDDQ